MKQTFQRLFLCVIVLTVAADSNSTSTVNETLVSNHTASTKRNGNSREALEEDNNVVLAMEQQRLMKHLFRNYDKNVRPVSDPSKNITIRIVPSVRQIVEIVSDII